VCRCDVDHDLLNSVPAGTVRLVIGRDYNGIGRAVTAQPPAATGGGYASVEWTATDSTCIT
jgi:hypothetical protein